MAADFAHNADAVVNRGRKAGQLYLRMCHDGLQQLPEDAETRRRIRKAVGLPRSPSVETWQLAGEMLAAWPPAAAPLDLAPGAQAGCGCWVDEDGLLYEHLPADRDAAGIRFEGWLCPHNAPVYLGEWRAPSRIPTVNDRERADYALEAVLTGAPPPRPPDVDMLAGLEVSLDPSLPPDVVEFRQPDGSVAARMTVDEAGQVTGTEILQPDPSHRPPCPRLISGDLEADQRDHPPHILPAAGGRCPGLPPQEPSAPVLNPHRITVALDRAGLQGPTADAKLGAVEPDLDNWEAGRAVPSWSQLERLAGMANVPIGFFCLPDDAEPTLMFARVNLGGRKGCHLVITMIGEPAGRPQQELPAPAGAEPDWWDL